MYCNLHSHLGQFTCFNWLRTLQQLHVRTYRLLDANEYVLGRDRDSTTYSKFVQDSGMNIIMAWDVSQEVDEAVRSHLSGVRLLDLSIVDVVKGAWTTRV